MNLVMQQQNLYVGPAPVGLVAGNRVRLDFPDQKVWARLAVATPYTPAIDDTVLVIGHSDSWYVVGVLEGSGTTCLQVPGDLEIRAPRGRIDLIAANGFSVKSPEVRIVSGKLEMIAKTVFQRFADFTTWVKNNFELRSAQMQTRVESTCDIRAGRIVEYAKEDIKIDAPKIRLG